MQCRGGAGRDGKTSAPEDLRGEAGQHERGERAEDRVGDLRERDPIGVPEGRRGEKNRVTGRAEIEQFRRERVVPRSNELLRGEEIRASVAEPERREPGDSDRRKPDDQREEEDEETGPSSKAGNGRLRTEDYGLRTRAAIAERSIGVRRVSPQSSVLSPKS